MVIGITATLNEADGFQRVNVEYIARIAQAGGTPLLITPVPGGAETNAELARDIIEHVDGLVLSGGGDIHPRHYVQPGLSDEPFPAGSDAEFELISCETSSSSVKPRLKCGSPECARILAEGGECGTLSPITLDAGSTTLDGRTIATGVAATTPGLGGLLAVCEERDGLELELARLAHERGIPTLGICRGMQVMNVALGGSLYRDLLSCGVTDFQHRQEPPYERTVEKLRIVEGSVLASILGTCGDHEVNTMHHQAVHRIAPALAIGARAYDGVIESLEDRNHPFYLGVQWHPEYLDEYAALFEALVGATRSE